MIARKALFAAQSALRALGNAPERYREAFGIRPRSHTCDNQAWEILRPVPGISRTSQLEGAAPTFASDNSRGKC